MLISCAGDVKDGEIIVCDINGELLSKQVEKNNGRLLCACKGSDPHTLKLEDQFEIEGLLDLFVYIGL